MGDLAKRKWAAFCYDDDTRGAGGERIQVHIFDESGRNSEYMRQEVLPPHMLTSEPSHDWGMRAYTIRRLLDVIAESKRLNDG